MNNWNKIFQNERNEIRNKHYVLFYCNLNKVGAKPYSWIDNVCISMFVINSRFQINYMYVQYNYALKISWILVLVYTRQLQQKQYALQSFYR